MTVQDYVDPSMKTYDIPIVMYLDPYSNVPVTVQDYVDPSMKTVAIGSDTRPSALTTDDDKHKFAG